MLGVLRARRTVGAVAPTSPGIGRRMAELAELRAARRVAELGPGTGAITRQLLAQMPTDARLWAFEIYPPFVEHLRTQVADPRLLVVPESAETIVQAVGADRPGGELDAVVSALPFSLMGHELTRRIVRDVARSLRPGGCFVALQYHPWHLAPHLRAELGRVSRELYLANLPPALLLHVRRST